MEIIQEPIINESNVIHCNGFAPIKPEYIIKKEEYAILKKELNEMNNELLIDENAPKSKRIRGMNRGREQAMTKAKKKVHQNIVRLCNSVYRDGSKCKFGSKCKAIHSLSEFWVKRPADLGPNCPIYDQFGKCLFEAACMFAGSHTDPTSLKQLVKESRTGPGPIINIHKNEVLQKMRKKQYDFCLSDKIVKDLTASTGAICREKLKLDIKSLNGKKYLAPLTTVGNLPFRRLCIDLGAEITCGEMTLATSLLQGFSKEWSLLKRHSSEKIFGVQVAGGFPDKLTRATQLIANECQVDFIDLNLGCPLDLVNDKCGGCTLANRSNRCLDVLRAMNLIAKGLPITVKMRYGMFQGERTSHNLMRRILDVGAAQLITLHPRSREQRYSKLAEYDYVPQCVKEINGRAPFWVCGDVLSYEDYYNRLEMHGVDGVMIGRGALIKPWIFTEIDERRHWDISATERLDLIQKFTNYGLEHWGSDYLGVQTTRRFMLEWLSFQCRYIPVGILEHLPQKINDRPPFYHGRNELETLLSSSASSDWIKITEMFLGKTPEGYLFVPKHNASAY